MNYNTWIVLAGTALLGASAGLVGSFAVLRGRSLMGDALAHAALPGLCVAFLLVGERRLVALQAGAFVSGILGILGVAALRRWTRIKEDASIGIVLSVFFGAGIVLVRIIQNRTTAGSKAGLDSYIYGKTAGMIAADVALIAGVSLGCLLIVGLLFKEFKLVAFDPGFARVQGWPIFALDVLLMTLIAMTVVIGLPAVGVVLMAALLILPAAAARFWTERLGRMLLLAAGFGLAIGAVGTGISARYSGLPTGPVIVLVGTALFLVSMTCAPRRGVAAQLVAQARFRRRLAEQQLLRAMYELYEAGAQGQLVFTPDELRGLSGGSAFVVRRVVARFRRGQLVELHGAGRYAWTQAGAGRAIKVARAYRLWDLFVARQPEMATQLVELDPSEIESRIPAELRQEFAQQLARDGRWPMLRGASDAKSNP